MALKKYLSIALVVIMVMALFVGSSIAVAQESPPEYTSGLHTGWMTENYTDYNNITSTYNRTFKYYIPTSYNSTAVPLLFSFHGLGSSGNEQRDLTQFDVLAEREGFIAVFPDATDLTGYSCNVTLPPLTGAEIMWNLGGGSLQYCAGIDDVGFVADMVNWFETNYAINASRIYATGMSNGAMFSYLLAFNLTGTFAGIAPVCSPMPWGFGNFTAAPITVILMHGTSDPILSYNGSGGSGGNVTYSVNETVNFWLNVDNITSPPVETVWGPTAADSTVVHRYVYSGGTNGTQVILFKVVGGGHTWPGGPQYLNPFFIGYVTNHIDGSGQIWKYLPPVPKYYLRTSSTYTSTSGIKFNTFGQIHYGGKVTTPGEGSFFYAAGINATVVNLTATPYSKYRFGNWTGDVSTIGNVIDPNTTITINPNTDYQITANFIAQYDLTTSSTAGGNVTTPGEGTHTYDVGTVVPLVATPDAGYRFVEWTGNVATIANVTAASTTITMNADRSVTANFAPIEEAPSGGCFIATAAYGTATAKQIDVLRAFRDDVLLKSTVGSRLVDLYYQVSPPIADFISEHNFVRTLVKEFLIDPIVWVVQTTENMWRS